MRWNPIDHMNAARANKPASGGKTYKRHVATQADLNAQYADEISRFCYSIKAAWRQDRKSILEDYLRAVYPERYEAFT